MQSHRSTLASVRVVPVLPVIVLALLGSGCRRPLIEPARPVPGHPSVPFAAAQLSTEWEPSPSKAYTTLPGGDAAPSRAEAPAPPLPPPPEIPGSRLTELLPSPPKGWWAEQVNIESSVVDDKSHYQTMASRSYAKAWAPSAPSVALAVRIDWGQAGSLKSELDATCAGFAAACKPITTALGDGHVVFVEASHSTEISILVQPNLAVQAWGQGVSAEELKGWIERIPADRLSKLVPSAP